MRLALVLAATVAFGAPFAEARSLTDATGARVEVADHPTRVVTLAPSLAELAADLVGTHLDRIVGVSEFTDYPPALKSVASIGPYSRFNLEKVASLKPDLVLATTDGNAKDQIDHLRELKVPVLVIASSSFAQIEASMRMVGEAMGDADGGAKMAARFAQGLANVRARASHHAPKRVLLQLGEDPLVVVGHDSFLNDALEAVGAKNAYGDLRARYPRPSLEDAAARDPDEILVLALGEDTSIFDAMAKHWARLGTLRAVRAKQVSVLRADPLLRPSLRLLEGLSRLEKAVYGEG